MFLEQLPNEIMYMIFDKIGIYDLYNMLYVCKTMNELVNNYVYNKDVKYILKLKIQVEELKKKIDVMEKQRYIAGGRYYFNN